MKTETRSWDLMNGRGEPRADILDVERMILDWPATSTFRFDFNHVIEVIDPVDAHG